MSISPQGLARLLSIPEEAANLILNTPPDIDEQRLCGRLEELVSRHKEERDFIWEIHKNCDQLLHRRLASFTAAQAMTLASFGVLTMARFQADPCKIGVPRIRLLEVSRFGVILLGISLAAAAFLVTYPMVKRLKFINENFLFEDRPVYEAYFDCIEWNKDTWAELKQRYYVTSARRVLHKAGKEDTQATTPNTKKPMTGTRYPYRVYRNIIPVWLPVAEVALWLVLFGLLGGGVLATYLWPPPPPCAQADVAANPTPVEKASDRPVAPIGPASAPVAKP